MQLLLHYVFCNHTYKILADELCILEYINLRILICILYYICILLLIQLLAIENR